MFRAVLAFDQFQPCPLKVLHVVRLAVYDVVLVERLTNAMLRDEGERKSLGGLDRLGATMLFLVGDFLQLCDLPALAQSCRRLRRLAFAESYSG